MSLWLDETIELITRSKINLKKVSYRSVIAIFYDHLSNRNLALLVATLYDLNENDIYFEIDKIVSDLSENDIDEIKEVKASLDQNGFEDWIESEEF